MVKCQKSWLWTAIVSFWCEIFWNWKFIFNTQSVVMLWEWVMLTSCNLFLMNTNWMWWWHTGVCKIHLDLDEISLCPVKTSILHYALRAVICWKGQVKTSTMLLYISLGQWVSLSGVAVMLKSWIANKKKQKNNQAINNQ